MLTMGCKEARIEKSNQPGIYFRYLRDDSFWSRMVIMELERSSQRMEINPFANRGWLMFYTYMGHEGKGRVKVDF